MLSYNVIIYSTYTIVTFYLEICQKTKGPRHCHKYFMISSPCQSICWPLLFFVSHSNFSRFLHGKDKKDSKAPSLGVSENKFRGVKYGYG